MFLRALNTQIDKREVLIILFGLFFIFSSSNSLASISSHPQKFVAESQLGETKILKLHLTNLGPVQNLFYYISSNEKWISFTPLDGNVKVKDTVDIEITLETKDLVSGPNFGSIIIGDPHHEPIIIPIEINVLTSTDVRESENANLQKFEVSPNPISTHSIISYNLAKQEFITIKLMNESGQQIQTILNELQNEGVHSFSFDSSLLSSGIYFFQINTNETTIFKKIIINH